MQAMLTQANIRIQWKKVSLGPAVIPHLKELLGYCLNLKEVEMLLYIPM